MVFDGRSLWGIFAVAAVLAAVLLICKLRRVRRAARLVEETGDKEKRFEINRALKPFGFAYSPRKGIFCSREDAWQRSAGYGKAYDEMAPLMSMVIDCEPIYFDYGGRRWLIEFWKGQYGIATGAEIGIYVKDAPAEESPERLFYDCVEKEGQMQMGMALLKNGKLMFERNCRHWWLTGFVLGEFSYPGELILEASLTFPEEGMLRAFAQGCVRAGYRADDVHVFGKTASLRFYHPKASQASRYGKWFRRLVQWRNERNCGWYHFLTRRQERTEDKLFYLMAAYPRTFRRAILAGKAVLGKAAR